MPAALGRLHRLVAKGLAATASLWPDIRTAYRWVHQVADLLRNRDGHDGATVQRQLQEVLATMEEEQAQAGTLASALAHFQRVTRSYWPGLFHCYAVDGLPRTNNDLEQLFGSTRYHERRATGRKQGAPGLVVRGAVRIVAAVATPAAGWPGEWLRPRDLGAWRQLRAEMEPRHQARRSQLRFRRDSPAYLAAAEALLLKPSLPS
jgi:hypothetical protein